MNADYDILGSELLQQSINPSLVIPSPRHEVFRQQMPQVPIKPEPKKEPTVILAPPPPPPQQQQLKPENKVVFDEMQYLQPIDGKNCVEIIHTAIDGAGDSMPKQRKIQIVKKLTAGPINEQQNLTLKVQKPATGGETIMAAGTPFVINKVNGNISGTN